MVEPKSNWVHVEGVECELFDQAHIPNGWMSGWGDGKTFHYHIPPPAPPRSEPKRIPHALNCAHPLHGGDCNCGADRNNPPRSEQETVVLHRDVEPDSISPKWDTCIFPASERESECHGFGGTPYEHAEFVPLAALEGAARDAAKKEREAHAPFRNILRPEKP